MSGFWTIKKTRHSLVRKADGGNRTRLTSLGSWSSTDELRPQNKLIITEPFGSASTFFINGNSEESNCTDASVQQRLCRLFGEV